MMRTFASGLVPTMAGTLAFFRMSFARRTAIICFAILALSCVSLPLTAADVMMPAESRRSTPPAVRSDPNFARSVADAAAALDSVAMSIDYVSRAVSTAPSSADRRALYAFLGSLQEAMSMYDDAVRSYAAACAIAAGDALGMPPRSNEMLVLDAVRCALCAGDHDTATGYLNTVLKSRDPVIKCQTALYLEWAAIAAATSESDLSAPLAHLRLYAADSAYSTVKAQVLLTLWYVAGDNSAAAALKRDAPSSVEAAIVSGKARMLPVPFWYFIVRMGAKDTAATASAQSSAPKGGSASATSASSGTMKATAPSPRTPEGGEATRTTEEERATHERIQLGLFRDRANADRLASTLTQKGFKPAVATETRESGTTYYIVVIDHPAPATEDALRTAGFEFYPVF